MIIFKGWNRPIYTYKALKRLSEVYYDLPLVISFDHCDPSMKQQQLEAIEMVGIQDAMVNFCPNQMGCAGHTKFLFELAFERHGADYIIHIEDDHYIAHDCINFLQWASNVVDSADLFAACSFHRPVHQDWKSEPKDGFKTVAKRWFDGSGPIMITKDRWKKIKDMGGMFGVNYISDKGRTFDCYGRPWLSEVRVSDSLSWVWPLHKYFGGGMYSLFPKVNRSINIGKVGLHANENIHQNIHYNPELIDNVLGLHNWLEPNDQTGLMEYDLDFEYDDRKFVEYGIEE